MASNPYKNKVIFDGNTLIDLTGDNVASNRMLSGTTAHDASGAPITGDIATKTQSDISVSGPSVTIPAGYYASQTTKSVSNGTAGTPTARKTAVSNHSLSVYPDVTNTTGWIVGTSQTGLPVVVSASELVSGTKTITENGTGIDVTNYATVDVSVPTGPKHTATITQGTTRRTKISYNNVTYRATDATFEFSAGDTCSLEAYGEMGGGTIYEDGVQIGTSDHSSPYTYTLPDCDVEFELQTNGTGRIDITKVPSGCNTYSLTNIVPQQTIATTTSNLYGYVGLIPTYTEYVQSGEWYLVTYDNVEYVVTGYYGANSEILIGDYQLITSNVEWLETPFMVEHNLGNNYFFLGSRVSGNHTLKVDKINFLDDGVTLINKTITANGTYNASSDSADGYSSVTVNVPGSSPNLQAKTNISPTTSSQTITPDSGYDGLSSVQINAMPSGTAGTPTATKGAVSSHAVTVTPSVTNSTGYITGGTKTGTGVTVTASELVSGSQTITENGTVNVTNLASVNVQIPFVTYYTGTTDPPANLGNNGDIYLKVVS